MSATKPKEPEFRYHDPKEVPPWERLFTPTLAEEISGLTLKQRVSLAETYESWASELRTSIELELHFMKGN